MKKVIYLFYTKVYDFEYEKYGLNLMKERGLEVESWSLEKIFFPHVYRKNSSGIKDGIRFMEIHNFLSFAKNVLIQKRRQTIFILQLPVHNINVNICEAIIKLLGHKYCMTYTQPNLDEYTCRKLSYSNLKKIWWEDIMDRMFPPEYNFVATKVNYLDFSSKDRIKKDNNVLIHTLDYDIYLKDKEKPRIIEEKYMVFVDEYYPFHGDFDLLRIVNPIKKAEKYYERLNKLFTLLENIYGCEIVIAEHPRADYSNKKELLYGRKHYKNITNRLIKDASLVVTHASTAQDYIVLNKKEFLIIYDSDIKNSEGWTGAYMPLINFFEAKALNISKNYCQKDIIKSVNFDKKNSYKKFYNKFIMGNEKNKMFFEVVINKISQL